MLRGFMLASPKCSLCEFYTVQLRVVTEGYQIGLAVSGNRYNERFELFDFVITSPMKLEHYGSLLRDSPFRFPVQSHLVCSAEKSSIELVIFGVIGRTCVALLK
jgi:hypothetical protein